MRTFRPVVAIVACCLGLAAPRPAAAGTVVRLTVFDAYSMDVELYDEEAPVTVQNFLAYVNQHSYDSTFLHRSTTGNPANIQVLQGGGFTITGNTIGLVTTGSAIPLEAGISNTRGTIAMARGNDPNSATSQWFFNVQNNPALDPSTDPLNPRDGYAVFGRIINDVIPPVSNPDNLSGLALLDALASVPAYDASQQLGAPFGELPLINPSLAPSNLLTVTSIAVVPVPEPAALVLACGGVAVAVVVAARRRRAAGTAPVSVVA